MTTGGTRRIRKDTFRRGRLSFIDFDGVVDTGDLVRGSYQVISDGAMLRFNDNGDARYNFILDGDTLTIMAHTITDKNFIYKR